MDRVRAASGLAGEPVAVNGVLGVLRPAGMHDLKFVPAVVVADDRDGQVRIGGQLDGEVAQLGHQGRGLLVDLSGLAAADDGLGNGDHSGVLGAPGRPPLVGTDDGLIAGMHL